MKMSARQQAAFDREMATARVLGRQARLDDAFRHLERAHVLGQRHIVPHVRSHWAMLIIELRRRRASAVWGQLTRVVLGALGSALGSVPAGNTGGTDISMLRRLPIDPALARLMDDSSPGNGG